jgi:hypothetical protein
MELSTLPLLRSGERCMGFSCERMYVNCSHRFIVVAKRRDGDFVWLCDTAAWCA